MRFRTRRHYDANDWTGQLFTFERTPKHKFDLDGPAFRLFVFWKRRSDVIPYPFEFQYRPRGFEPGNGFVWPKRKQLTRRR